MDYAKEYIETNLKSSNKEVLIKIIDASIVEENNFEAMVDRVNKIITNEFKESKK